MKTALDAPRILGIIDLTPATLLSANAPDDERLSNLHPQAEARRLVPDTPQGSTEDRLTLLTEQCAELLRRWSVISERHARAVGRFEGHLGELSTVGSRLQDDAAQRIRNLEGLVRQEWQDLRQLQEEPVRQLHEHASNLTQVCIATADAAQQYFDRAEGRLAAIEQELHDRMTDVTRELQTVVSELRAQGAAPLAPGAVPIPAAALLPAAAGGWPLEGVTRLHHQLRQTDAPAALRSADLRAQPPSSGPAGALPEVTVVTERLDTLERSLGTRDARIREAEHQTERATRAWRAAVAVLTLLVIAGGTLSWRLKRAVDEATAHLDSAQRDAQRASDRATREVAASRDESARAMREVMARAAQAQAVSDVLAAPDLVRFTLSGRDTLTGAAAQLHFSRTRGIVFSGSRLAPAPANQTYQLWLLTRAEAVEAARFIPDAAGAATVAVAPPRVARAVVGAMVTLEPGPGSRTPTGPAVMARAGADTTTSQ